MSRLQTKKVYIRSHRPHHPALQSCKEGRVRADQFDIATKDQCWTLKHLGNDMYNIRYKGWYLQASPDGKVSCGSRTGNNNEQWKIEYIRKGYVSIKSRYNRYCELMTTLMPLQIENTVSCGSNG